MARINVKQSNKETNDLIVEVFRLNGLLLSTADKLASRFGLTGARWQVLGAIAQADAPETTARIARNMGLTRQSVQRIVNEMIADQLLQLEENPHHKRSKLVVMTPKGMKVFDQAIELQDPWVKALSDGISKKRLKEAQEVLAQLGAKLAAE